jgi:hypothetical protein
MPNQLKLYITSALIHVSGLSELIRTSKGKHKQASKSKQARASTSKQAKANKGKQAKTSKGFEWLYQHKIRKRVHQFHQHFLNERAKTRQCKQS